MIDHVDIVVSDLGRAERFYAAALLPLGYRVAIRVPGGVGFRAPSTFAEPGGRDPGGDFWIHEGAVGGERAHVAFHARGEAEVRAFHAAAMRAGGRNNGHPKPMPYHPGYFAAYAFDPDGTNVEAVIHDFDGEASAG